MHEGFFYETPAPAALREKTFPGANVPQARPGGVALCDRFGRTIDYIRLSLTDRCNFRCVYCMPGAGQPFISHDKILRYEDLLRLCQIMSELGVTKYKITGGEPLCRKDAVPFISRLGCLPHVEDVSLTTNGSLLSGRLEAIAAAGVTRVTFSCDALEQQTFGAIVRSQTPLNAVLENMRHAAALGMRVKMNTVPLRDYNYNQLVPLARLALENGSHIRFIELMPVGEGNNLHGVPQEEVFSMMEKAFGPLTQDRVKAGNGPAVMYSARNYPGRIGFIAAISEKFCTACNRVRLASTGFLRTCLCHDAGIDLAGLLHNGASDETLAAAIISAVLDKPQGHVFSSKHHDGRRICMNSVGG